MTRKMSVHVLPDGMFRLEDWIPFQCSVITNRVSATLARMYMEEFGLTVVEWRIVAVLGSHPPMSAKVLAESTAMDQVSITRAVASLVKKRLVSRRTDSEDRRRVVLRLSKSGLEAYGRVVPLARAIEVALVSSLSRSTLAELRAALEKVVERANQVLSEAADWRELMLPGSGQGAAKLRRATLEEVLVPCEQIKGAGVTPK